MSTWKEHRLGELADIVMGQSPPGETCNELKHGSPLLNGPTEFGNSYPVPVQFTTDPRKFAKAHDLLFCVRGSTTGRMNWADQDYAIGRGIAAIRHRKGEKYRHFIKGILDFNLKFLLQSATGSTFPNVSKDQLNNLVVSAPSLDIQESIAEILSSLDDKIELNNQINKELEALAQSLFKHWFIDFEFPISKGEAAAIGMPSLEGKPYKSAGGEMIGSELGEIPRNWSIACIDDVTEVVTKGTTPTSIGGRFTETGINFIKVESLSEAGSFIRSKFGFIDEETNLLLKRSIIKEGDVLFSIAGTIGRVAVAKKSILPANTNQAIAIIRPNKVDSYFLKLLMQSSLIQNDTHANVVQAVQANLSLGVIRSTKFILPTERVLKEYHAATSHMFDAIEELTDEAELLSKLRDTLLPKLISGELELSQTLNKEGMY